MWYRTGQMKLEYWRHKVVLTGLILQTGTQRQIMQIFHFTQFFLKKKEYGSRHRRKEEAGNHVTFNLLIFCLEKEVGVLSGQGGGCGTGMKYIANGKRHQQEIGARRWRPRLIKTNCRWAWIFILTENRLPPSSRLQQSESTSTHGKTKHKPKLKKRNQRLLRTHKACNWKDINAFIALIFSEVREARFECFDIKTLSQSFNARLRQPDS